MAVKTVTLEFEIVEENLPYDDFPEKWAQEVLGSMLYPYGNTPDTRPIKPLGYKINAPA